jgi:uncharacterized membrane protein
VAPLLAGGMTELFRHPLSRAALWFAVIFALSALAVLVLRRWRDGAFEDQSNASKLLTKFRELHGRGSLSDDEYRTIKTKLARELENELKDTDETS